MEHTQQTATTSRCSYSFNTINSLGQRVVQLERTAPTGRSSSHSSVKPNKPATFDGSNAADTDSWIFSVDLYLAATNTTDPQSVAIVVTFLKGVALQWWQSECKRRSQQPANSIALADVTTLPPINTWLAFQTALRHRFLPIEASRTARAQLQSLRQRQGQSVHEYNARYQSLMALISDMAEADRIEYYTRGLLFDVRRDVVLRMPATIDDAMHLATRSDSLMSLVVCIRFALIRSTNQLLRNAITTLIHLHQQATAVQHRWN